MRKKKKIWLKLGILLAAALIIVSGIWFYIEWKTFKTAEDSYDLVTEVLNQATSKALSDPKPRALPASPNGVQSAVGNPSVDEPESILDNQQKAILKIKEPESPYRSRIDFDALAQINDEVVGWIRNEDTVIDYPITHTNNNTYYLEHLFTKAQNPAGCIFLDTHNTPDFSDQNSIIYGHHSRSKRMFASITFYRNKKYYDEHPTMYLYTPTQDYMVEIFAGVVINPGVSIAPFYNISFADGEDFLSYVNRMRELSDFDADVELKEDDKLLTLSTCSYEFYNARYVLMGKLVALPSATDEELDAMHEEG